MLTGHHETAEPGCLQRAHALLGPHAGVGALDQLCDDSLCHLLGARGRLENGCWWCHHKGEASGSRPEARISCVIL
ncbi:hypothetical protein GCM10027026_23500 [Myroides odoratimimus subsp. xuanwuensis]